MKRLKEKTNQEKGLEFCEEQCEIKCEKQCKNRSEEQGENQRENLGENRREKIKGSKIKGENASEKKVEKKKLHIAKNFLICLGVAGVSFALGAVFGDFWLGPLTLCFGTLNAYFLAVGHWVNYIFGMGFSALYSYACALSGLYGYVIFAVVVYFPIHFFGLFNWLKNKQNSTVKMRSLGVASGISLCVAIVGASALLGWLLTLIPSQNLAFLDSTSQIINIGGVVMTALRFREGWYIWLANNTVDLAIWIINSTQSTQSSAMMLAVSIVYLVMNIYGLVVWIRTEQRQKKK